MDRLKIRLTPHETDDLGQWVGVDLLVNGDNLNDLIAAYERRRGYEPAGGYDSISLDGLQPAAERLAGTPDSWPGGGETVMLVCDGCREEGCWPMFARVDRGSEAVEWSDFRQPHRPERDYANIRFVFDRRQYDDEITQTFGQH